MAIDLKTDQTLLGRLAAAAQRGVTPVERRQQRISFVYGNLPKSSGMTRFQVEQELERIDERA